MIRVVRATPALLDTLEGLGALEREVRALLHDPDYDLARELARPCGVLAVALDEGRAIGTMSALRVTDELHVLSVAVLEAGQRRGVGRALVALAEELAREDGASVMLLEVRRDNAGARAFYEALGFFCFNVRRRYYADGEDALELVRGLAPGADARFLPAVDP